MTKSPARLSVEACAAVVTEFTATAIRVRHLGLNPEDHVFTPRMIRYGLRNGGMLRYVAAPSGRGVRGWVDTVEASVSAIVWLVFVHCGENPAWAVGVYLGEAMRDGLRNPAKRLALQIRGAVGSITPTIDADPDAEVVIPLADIRSVVDSIARRLGYADEGGGPVESIDVREARALEGRSLAAIEAQL